MKRAAPAFSFARIVSLLLPVAPITLSVTSCVPPSSNLQSARTLDEGQTRITPYVVNNEARATDGEGKKISENYGLLIGIGSDTDAETQVRIEQYRFADPADGLLHFVSFGPKFEVVENTFAVLMPMGMYFGRSEDGGVSNPFPTLQFHPGLVATIPASRYFEINTAGKFVIPVMSPQFSWYAFSVGAGLSTDVRRWAVMPEVSYTTTFASDGEAAVLSYGVGLAFYRN